MTHKSTVNRISLLFVWNFSRTKVTLFTLNIQRAIPARGNNVVNVTVSIKDGATAIVLESLMQSFQ